MYTDASFRNSLDSFIFSKWADETMSCFWQVHYIEKKDVDLYFCHSVSFIHFIGLILLKNGANKMITLWSIKWMFFLKKISVENIK